MGCGYDFACKTCRKSYYLGYGSYSTWHTFPTVEAFDEAPTGSQKTYAKNERIRECLIEHRGHDHEYIGWDWAGVEGGKLYSDTGPYGASELWIEDYGDWEHIDLEERDAKACTP